MKKDLTKIGDLNREDVQTILSLAVQFRENRRQGMRREERLHGKVTAMIFEKPSLRTKVAFEVAAAYLGGVAVFLTSDQILASAGEDRSRESIPDIARNLERFTDLLVARVYDHNSISLLAATVKIPVINALCDSHHPTQALADLMTIRQFKGNQQGLKVVFVGDGNNVATSLLQICALTGINFAIASPCGYEICLKERNFAQELAASSGAHLEFYDNPISACREADVIYSDTFISMGQEKEMNERREIFKPFQVNSKLLQIAKDDCLFMHCLPAHRGEEVTDEVMDGKNSVVFEQAENRLHIATALLCFFLENQR